jgi:sterol desaturase/sphingolipid hydroxylase (fatty acid hydroxylase superfamily)
MIWSLISHIIARFAGFAAIVVLANWLLIVVGAAVMFFVFKDHNLPKTLHGFVRYCFPPEMFKTRSCRADIVLWLVNFLLAPFLITPLLLGSIFFSAMAYACLTRLFGTHAQIEESTTVWVAVAVVVTIGVDFATFYTHYLFHKVPAFWEFHKVHHSAEFLTPISNKRMHPFEVIFDANGVALVGGMLLGTFSYVLSMPIYENTIIGVDAYFLLNTFSFFNLRHSHISMSYGRLEKWLLSPAQHQVHHSSETRHWDKNIGLFLSVWDRLFGTFVYSEPRGSYRLGLPGNEGSEYTTAWQLYTMPFVRVFRMAARHLPFKPAVAESGSQGPLVRFLNESLVGHPGPSGIEDGSANAGPSGSV